MTTVTLNYWGGARAAAGVERESVQADSVAAALAQVQTVRPGQRLVAVLAVSSLMVDGQVWNSDQQSRHLDADVEVDVLPPFAGG